MTTEQRIDSIERLLETVAANQIIFQQNIEKLEAQVAQTNKNLEDSISDLASTIVHFVEEGERDRRTLVETANADRAEIRRILDYLFGQQQNGNGQSNQS